MIAQRRDVDAVLAAHLQDGLPFLGLNLLTVYGQCNHATTSFLHLRPARCDDRAEIAGVEASPAAQALGLVNDVRLLLFAGDRPLRAGLDAQPAAGALVHHDLESR